MDTELLRAGLAALVRASLAVSLALGLVLLLRAPLRRAVGAGVAYLIWLLVPVSLAWSLLPPPQIVVVAASVSLPAAGAPLPAAAAPPAPAPLPWEKVWVALWLAGVLTGVAVLGSQQRRFVRALGRLRRREDGWQAEHGEGCPAVVGLLPPRVVLPPDFDTRYAARERSLILAHERVHLTRGDAWINAFAALLRCLFWFHPLLPYAAARFRQDQELACDAVVLRRHPHARRAYAGAMLKTQLADLGLPVGCHWQSSHPLQERIAMLKHPLPGLTRRALGAAFVAVLAVGGGYAAWAAQPAATVAAAQPGDKPYVDASFEMQLDGGTPDRVRVVSLLGQPFGIHSDDAGVRAWEAEFTATPLDGGRIDLAGVLKRHGDTVSTPRLILREGEPGEIKVGEESGGRFHGMDLRLTLTRAAQATPTAVAAAPVAASGADRDPAYRRLSPPAWPAGVHDAQGTVVVRARIGIDGKVKEAQVARASEGADAFRATALATVEGWTFEPAQREGKPVEGWALVPLRFGAGQTPADLVDHAALDELRVAEPAARREASAPPAPNATARKATAAPATAPAAPRGTATPALAPLAPVAGTAAPLARVTGTSAPLERLSGAPAPLAPVGPLHAGEAAPVAPTAAAAPSEAAVPATPAAGETPASEDVSYRRLQPPSYPPVAIRESFGAKLTLKVQVKADGTPGTVEVATLDLIDDPHHKRDQRATPQVRREVADAIASNAIDTVKRWRFNAATQAGKPVEGWVYVPISYALSGGGI